MSLVTPAELAVRARVDLDASVTARLSDVLSTAEAMIANHIGASDLADRTVNDYWNMTETRSLLPLSEGPASILTTCLVDGVVLIGVAIHRSLWSLERPTRTVDVMGWLPTIREMDWQARRGGFYAGQQVTATYQAGWTPATLPPLVRHAILLTADAIWENPRGLYSQGEGSDRVGYNRGEHGGAASLGELPFGAQSLVARYRRSP